MPDDYPASTADRRIGQYLAALGAPEPTPGGGSASGIVGALAVALGQMALSLTDIDGSDHTDELRHAQETLGSLRDRYLELAREDESAYQGYRNAADLPRDTAEEKSIRKIAMQDALRKAAGVPMAMCEASAELAEALAPIQAYGNKHLRSDAMVAATFTRACFEASRILVETNLGMIKDRDWVEDASFRLDEYADRLEGAANAR